MPRCNKNTGTIIISLLALITFPNCNTEYYDCNFRTFASCKISCSNSPNILTPRIMGKQLKIFVFGFIAEAQAGGQSVI